MAAEIPLKKAHQKKKEGARKNLYMAYRWPASVHQQICNLAGDTFSRARLSLSCFSIALIPTAWKPALEIPAKDNRFWRVVMRRIYDFPGNTPFFFRRIRQVSDMLT